MTAHVWHVGKGETVVACDTAQYDINLAARSGHMAKLAPLPHLNAVLAGGTWAWTIAQVTAEALTHPVRDLADLRARLPDVIGKWHGKFVRRVGPENGIDFEERWPGCVFYLFAPGEAWLLGDEFAWEAKPLPAGLWADPDVGGSCHLGDARPDDRRLLDLLRRQARETTRHVGGSAVRARLTRRGTELATIGSLDEPAMKAPSGKVGRNEPCPCGSGQKFKRCCGR